MQVATIHSLRVKGVSQPSDVERLTVHDRPTMCSLDEAMTKHWNADQFILNYTVPGDEVWPRINKGLLAHLRSNGQDIVSQYLIFDYDNEAKACWDNELMQGTFSRFFAACAAIGEWADKFRYLYTTLHGFRVVYKLDTAIPVDDLERRMRWLAVEFAKHDIDFDPAAMDWTRCFRLPYVIRDGRKSWEMPFFEMMEQDVEIPVTKLGRTETYKAAVVQNITMPGAPLENLVETHDGNRVRDTSFTRKAKAILKGTEAADVIFNHEQIAIEGGRNSTLTRIVGMCVGKLYRVEGASPQHVWALLHPSVAQLEPDDETDDWFAITWSMICRFWAVEDERAEKWARERREREELRESTKEAIIEGMREWCTERELDAADIEDSWTWVSRRLLLSLGGKYYPMAPNGYYSTDEISRDVLPNALRDLGMDCVIDLQKFSKQSGEMQDISPDSLIRKHGTQIRGVSSVGTHTKGGTVHKGFLEINTFRRRDDIVPEFSEQVDQWLLAVFGDQKDIVCEWIAQSLAWDEGPICALSIFGPRSVGKQMLCRGLAECTTSQMYAPSKCVVGEFHESLLYSPYIVVNEGWPTGRRAFNAADRFRELTAGDPITVNIKYRAEIQVSVPYRVVMCANNRDVVFEIAGNRDLSVEDREALAERILHVEIDDAGRRWLEKRGGRTYTEGWIEGSGKGTSKSILAKHFLYLYHHCRTGKYASARFLVAGSQNAQIIRDMRKRVGSAGLVVEACIQAMKAHESIQGIYMGPETYAVTAQAIREWLKKDSMQLSAKDVSTALKGISLTTSTRVIKGKGNGHPLKWYDLDCQLLLEQAQEMGFQYPKELAEIAKKS